MFSQRKKLAAIIILTALFTAPASLRAEPVSMVILAPLALKGANMASPYVIRCMQNTGNHLLYIGKDLAETGYLPLGVIQCTAGAPFGLFNNGLANIGTGCCAPFKLVVDILVLPLAMFGIGM